MSSDPSPENPAYPNGIPGILTHMDKRRAPLGFGPGEALPPLDCDLAKIARQTTSAPGPAPDSGSDHARKVWDLARELKGQNALLHLNALLIAHLRKRAQPPHTAALFQRLWTEQGELLLTLMDLRWKVSSLTTFGDHGTTPEQRSAGLALSTLFNTMKLYESERLFSGRAPDRPFPLDGHAAEALPLGMRGYSLTNGGLDVNMIGRLWQEADQDDVIRPLAQDMLKRLINDPGTVFRRLHRLRIRKQRRLQQDRQNPKDVVLPVPPSALPKRKGNPSWGVVCTTNAPRDQVARFIAHHLDLGAQRIYLFLDAPDPEVTALLDPLDRVTLTLCDDAYWHGLGKTRMEAHQLRQSFNATRALRLAEEEVDWLGHIDVDEFILGKRRFATALKKVPDGMAAVRLWPAEALATETPETAPTRFKLRSDGPDQPPEAVHDIYPTFGSYLRGGFLSHTAGKIFARTGLGDARLKIHRLRFDGQDVANITTLPDTYIGHLHAPDWDSFRAKLAFRRTKGSYRVRPDEPPTSVGHLMAYLSEEEGEAGLRHFFEEMCLDSPELRRRLTRHDLLIEPGFDPDASIRSVFGAKPKG